MVGGPQNDSGLLGAMGIPEAMWDKMRDEAILEVWPENWAALEVFGAMQTQWRVGMSGPTGLDYAALPAVLDLLGITERADCFAGVQIMESEALDIFRARSSG